MLIPRDLPWVKHDREGIYSPTGLRLREVDLRRGKFCGIAVVWTEHLGGQLKKKKKNAPFCGSLTHAHDGNACGYNGSIAVRCVHLRELGWLGLGRIFALGDGGLHLTIHSHTRTRLHQTVREREKDRLRYPSHSDERLGANKCMRHVSSYAAESNYDASGWSELKPETLTMRKKQG